MTPVFCITAFAKVSSTRRISWGDNNELRHLWDIQASSRVRYMGQCSKNWEQRFSPQEEAIKNNNNK